ncbi:MAG: hypothetical protein WBN32_10285 [Woeseia sp.]
MAKRGRILTDPTAGPGRVMVQGRQHAFGLDGVWKSDALPRPGVVVDVEFDETGRIRAMMAVPEARLAREQVEAALAFARSRGADLGATLTRRSGLLQLAALALLVVGWFWLGTIEADAAFRGHWTATFWQVLGALDTGRPLGVPGSGAEPAVGLYRLIAILCLGGPMLAWIWQDRRAYLASLSPLALTLIVALQGPELLRPVGAKAISLDVGAYLAALAGFYLALAGIGRFLVAKAHDVAAFYENE